MSTAEAASRQCFETHARVESLGARTLTLTLPPNAVGELVVHPDEMLNLQSLGKGRFALPAGEVVNIELRHT